MNLATVLVLAVILLAAVVAVVFLIHRKRHLGSSACCGCALRNVCGKR